MGYSTDFGGSFKLSKEPSKELLQFIEDIYKGSDLAKINELYVKKYKKKIENESYPESIPNAYLQWIVTKENDGYIVEWDCGEKFDEYEDWLNWLIDILLTEDIRLSGTVEYQGESMDDRGFLTIVEDEIENTSIYDIVEEYKELKVFKQFAIDYFSIGSLEDAFNNWKNGLHNNV